MFVKVFLTMHSYTGEFMFKKLLYNMIGIYIDGKFHLASISMEEIVFSPVLAESSENIASHSRANACPISVVITYKRRAIRKLKG